MRAIIPKTVVIATISKNIAIAIFPKTIVRAIISKTVIVATISKTVTAAIEEAKADGLDHPSYFETLFLMGMLIFQESGVEYVILETGLGGLYDCTNIITKPLVSIVV